MQHRRLLHELAKTEGRIDLRLSPVARPAASMQHALRDKAQSMHLSDQWVEESPEPSAHDSSLQQLLSAANTVDGILNKPSGSWQDGLMLEEGENTMAEVEDQKNCKGRR
jgi:hypothetical protein